MNKIYPILGSHVSLKKDSKYLIGSIKETVNNGANTFMVFVGPPQSTIRKDVSEMYVDEFKEMLNEYNIDSNDLIAHAPYIINIANSVHEVNWKFGVDFLIKEIKRCQKIGINTIVLHPGAYTTGTIDESLNKLIDGLNIVTKNTSEVKIALETMSGKGTEIGTSFEQLQYVIDRVKDKSRIGVCLDTCHMNDAGYDVKDWKGIKKQIKNTFGLEKVLVFHIGDSKNAIGAHKDRHENLGYGTIGFDALNTIVWDKEFKEIPKILETPFNDGKSPYKIEIEDLRNQKYSKRVK